MVSEALWVNGTHVSGTHPTSLAVIDVKCDNFFLAWKNIHYFLILLFSYPAPKFYGSAPDGSSANMSLVPSEIALARIIVFAW